MANDNLSEFRKKWLKELQKRSEQKYEEPSTSSYVEVSSSQSHDEEIQAASSIKNSNDLLHPDCILDKGTEECILDKGTEDRSQSERKQQHCSAINEENQVVEVQKVVVNNVFECSTESSATYYPFRILTSLLNHASAEKGPKYTRKSRRESQSKETRLTATPKRKYFSNSNNDVNESDVSKKAKKKDVMHIQQDEKETDSKDYLDLFIADLNEISEIPFFDVSLPREVAIKIFWYLDILDLCRCAQVSKSWRSLAEDELLWCGICHKMGFETDTLTVEHSNWKSRVRQYTIIKRSLELNWKGRTGKLHNLHYAKGGVLCAVHSRKYTVVAGYSNCQTKLWDVMSGETCIFQPSSTALIIDESEEEGTISNEVLHVATCDKITAASYSHGFVDVWSNEEGTEPLYTFTCEGQGSLRQPTSLELWENQQNVYLSITSGHHLQVHTVCSGEGCMKDTVVFDSVVKKTKWLQDTKEPVTVYHTPTLSIATDNTVSVLALYERELGCSYDMLELHNIVDAPVTCMDARLCPEQVVVGFTLSTGPAQYFRMDVYDIITRKMSATLTGHTACVLCVNMAESPQHQLVTGSRDRKVRVFDTRVTQSALMTLMGHSAAVTTVQMDEWKVVSGDEAGFVRVWDQRMASKLWEMNNRHPVRYCHFEERQLVVGHVPYIKQHYSIDEFDTGLHQRHRGSLHVYDFLADQTTQGVPEICLSTYDEPQGYNYNIGLAVPYDQV